MPTVTLPRLKALLSGSVPSFRDYVLNLNAYAFTSDNLISSLATSGRRIVFYGDDTWGKLFPPESSPFIRSELTSSFFVSDTVTVDTNVTRNVDLELQDLDSWDVMVLHYLGLDHIGHGHGYHSSLMDDKLLEMDQVVERIYGSLEASNISALLVVTGDHGMTNGGNHGGATREETHTPLIFLSTSKKHKRKRFGYKNRTMNDHQIQSPRPQIDFTSTLASLFRLPIPAFNKGVLIDAVLGRFGEPVEVELCAKFTAATQLQSAIPGRTKVKDPILFEELKNTLERAMRYHELHLEGYTVGKYASFSYLKADEKYGEFLHSVQQSFVTRSSAEHSKSQFLLLFLLLGMLAVIGGLFALEWKNRLWSILFNIVLNCNADYSKRSPSISSSSSFHQIFALLLILTHIFSLSSTSFIQSEHRFWNTAAGGIVTFLIFSQFIRISNGFNNNNSHHHFNRKSFTFYLNIAFTAVLAYLTLTWRQTELTTQWGDAPEGDHLNDLYSMLKRPENSGLATLVFVLSLVGLGWSLDSFGNVFLKAVQSSGLCLAYLYRYDFFCFLNLKFCYLVILLVSVCQPVLYLISFHPLSTTFLPPLIQTPLLSSCTFTQHFSWLLRLF